MAFIEIRYQIDQTGLLPLCEVILLGKSRRVPVRALVDSGATYPLFPEATAEDAGIDLSKCRPFRVMFGGSSTDGRIADVHVEIQGQRLRLDVIFVKEILLGYALLGRKGLFSQFKEVAFMEKINPPRVQFRG